MNFFTNKKFLFKLIVSICLCLTIWNFGISSLVQAVPTLPGESGYGNNQNQSESSTTTNTDPLAPDRNQYIEQPEERYNNRYSSNRS